MFDIVLRKLFGSTSDRIVKKCQKNVSLINAKESYYESLSDSQLQDQTYVLKERLSKGENLDDILVDAFAVVREASKRVLGMRPFDVQLIGGMILHQGMVSEMKTGEGKTLVATLPVYLNALSGKGVHLVTINDYLVHRDSEWMGKIYRFLGLSVGCIVHGLTDPQRRGAYNADITYGTNHEFGFDYLRDNMKFRLQDMVQRPFNYGIVDEVDSILIDEARTPLIISGSAEDSSALYLLVDKVIPQLQEGDYEKDEKHRSVTLTDAGIERIEEILRAQDAIKGSSLYDIQNISVVHHVNQALKAHKIFNRDVDYIVKDGQVMIIDEFTGRMMEGRRYSDGLHQALEAKEGVEIEMENQTLASITYQNFFRLYPKLAGMTGTAITEASEFEEIYKLRVVEVPTNKPVCRLDNDDEVYLTAREKYTAMIALIEECRARNQPVLVGTTSIEKSELISQLLTSKNISHQVLNARYHEQEAAIIAQAGYPGAVTIATNMAGRGTDIKLGGNYDMRVESELADVHDETVRSERTAAIRKEIDENQKIALDAGGLYVIGTERHESRRVDNQLRGRSGRQGDPGASKFYISLEDDLMRIFGSERLGSMLERLGVKEGEAISHTWINKAMERAQRKVEARNFDMRKHLLRYDDVMNDQRKIIYEQRRELMSIDSIKDIIDDFRHDVVHSLVKTMIPPHSMMEDWSIDGLHEECVRLFGLNLPIRDWCHEEGISEDEIYARIMKAVTEKVHEREENQGSEEMRIMEKNVFLRLLDQNWKEHLLALDHLRQGINLRAYAQSNPLNEYKREAFNLFQGMKEKLKADVASTLILFEAPHEEDDGDQVRFMDFMQKLMDSGIDFDKLNELHPEVIETAMVNASSEDQDNTTVPQLGIGNASKPTVANKAKKATDKDIKPNTKPTTKKASKAVPSNGLSTPDKKTSSSKKKSAKAADVSYENIKRNDLCPCQSGKKFKHCHGSLEA